MCESVVPTAVSGRGRPAPFPPSIPARQLHLARPPLLPLPACREVKAVREAVALRLQGRERGGPGLSKKRSADSLRRRRLLAPLHAREAGGNRVGIIPGRK